jgi:SMP-30/Gluconolactonase/LRE-like region
VFAELGGGEPGVPDGMKVDSAGNVYCGGSGGIWILDAKGKKLGRIVHGQPQTTNLAFGGADWKTLYFTNARFLGSVNLKIAGTPVPGRKRHKPGVRRPASGGRRSLAAAAARGVAAPRKQGLGWNARIRSAWCMA